MYINICISLSLSLFRTHSLSLRHTLTAWVSPHLEQIKGLSCLQCYPEVSECWCWELVLLGVSGAGEEMKRNHIYPGVAELRKFYYSTIPSLIPSSITGVIPPLALYCAHLLHSCLLSKKIFNSCLVPFELSTVWHIDESLRFCQAAFLIYFQPFKGECVLFVGSFAEY